MADYPAIIDGSGGIYPNTEHYLRRVLVGNVADVRRRLNDVLERLDYDFIDEGEDEIEARRSARGWANAYASADVLDYPRSLLIKLKPLSEHSTRASFVYVIKHPSLNRGEKEVLTREAETIATLATIRATDKVCKVCGAEASDDSRFCRKCGAPMTGDETALEILRMAAEIRSGHTSIVASAVMVVLTALITLGALLLLIAGTPAAGVKWLLLLSVAFGLMNVAFIGFGWKRMNNALKSKKAEPPAISGAVRQTFTGHEDVSALPPAPASFSVTDGTTRHLNYSEKTPVPEDRDRQTTADLD